MKTKTIMKTVALAGATSLVLSGCAGDRGAGGGESADGKLKTVQTTPAPSGELDKLVWNSTYGEPASLDPIKAFNYPENTVVANLCEPLMLIQPDFSVKPNLAKSVETEDGKVWTIKLQKGVKFWDGTEMTANDVVFSIKRHLDPNEGSYWAGGTLDSISSVTSVDADTVEVKLSNPDFLFDETLATIPGVVVSEKNRKAAGENYGNPETGVMCTGPFKFTPGNWKQGQSITLERNDDYWNKDKVAKAKQVQISFVEDTTAISSALSTGEFDGSYDVPLPALGQLESDSNGTLYYGDGMQNMAVISTGQGLFGDPAVRRAITRATDRQAIADTVYEGTGTPARSVIPQSPWDAMSDVASIRDKELPDLSYDIEAAKKELEKSNADLSQTIKIAYPSERGFYADILNEMARGAKELGITLKPTGIPSAQFGALFSDAEARKGYDGFVTTNYLSAPDPLLQLFSIGGSNGDSNYSGYNNPEVDKLLGEALAEKDAKKRAELTAEAEGLIMQDLPWVPVNDLAVRLYMKEGVTGAPASFVYLYYPWAADIGAK